MRRIAITATLWVIQLATLAPARANEATSSGVSVGAGVDWFHDGTLTDASGQSLNGGSGELRLGVLGNIGDFAVGAVLAGSPGIFGDGRLLVGGRAGWQPTFGTTRVQLLAEVGVHRYTRIDEGLFGSSTPDSFTTNYLGAELGMTRAFGQGAPIEYGVALFVRQDMNQQTIVHSEANFLGGPSPPPTDLTVGGTMIGVSFTLVFRVDRASLEWMKLPHPFGR